MQVQLPFGDGHIDARVPDDAVVLMPERTTPLSDATAAIRAAIEHPLASAPLAAKRSAIPRPIPLSDPVMSATFPSSLSSIFPLDSSPNHPVRRCDERVHEPSAVG